MFDIIKKFIESTPYYKQNCDYTNAACFEDLPILTKYDVIKNMDLFVPSTADLFSTQTSGSSGIPMSVFWNKADYLQSMLCLWRKRETHGIYPTDFYLTCHVNLAAVPTSLSERVIVSKNFISFSKECYSKEILAFYTQYIKLFKPKWIMAQPSFVYYLGEYLNEYDFDLLKEFVYIELVGELLTDNIKNAIKKRFPFSVVKNMYGLQEFNGVLYEEDDQMYPIDENIYVELVNESGQRCVEGEEGNIVITGLKNTVFPLIRYRTDDKGIMRYNGDRVYYEITEGRSNDEFTFEGRRYDGVIFFEVINEYNKSHPDTIAKFQVLYENDFLLFKLFSFGNLPSTNEIEKDLRKILSKSFSIELPIKVEIGKTDFFMTSRKGKYFINKKGGI